MTGGERLCTECLGLHADGQCLLPSAVPQVGDGLASDTAAVSRDRLDVAAATIRRLLEINQAQLDALEGDLERARNKIRQLSATRVEARRAVKTLGQALEWLTTAAAAIPKRRTSGPQRPSAKPN